MAIDPAQIDLTHEQKERLAKIAEREGKDYRQIIDELLTLPPHANGAEESSSDITELEGPANLYDALDAIGAVGCFEGPGDLSTNPKHMEGFGINASRRTNSD